MMTIRFLILFIVLTAACDRRNSGTITLKQTPGNAIHHARGFELNSAEHSIILTVRNPWQNASGIEYRYIFSDTIASSRPVDEFTWAIRTPVKSVICLSTTHIGFISFIGETESIKGVSGKNYIVNEFIREQIAAGNIHDVGYDEGLDYELIVKLKPDIVFAYGVSVSITNTIRKLNELGIPVLLIGEYLEQDPLGKMEWIKAVAICYGKQEEISQVYDSVVNRYHDLSRVASKAVNKPEVLLGLPWRGNWYVSGARSYIARLVADAGGNYIWRQLDFNESRPMGLEKIYEKALTAQFWINPGEARTIKEIISVDPRFGNLPPVINDKVYNNDNRMSPSGGNDFFESGVTEPDIILSDLITILHPQLLPSHKLKYYRKVN